MPLLLLAVPFVLILLVIVLMPLTLVQRYRVGTSTRQARSWVATANVVAMAFSIVVFMMTAAVMTAFVAGVFTYALLGLLTGGALGILGVWWSRWDAAGETLRYTPNRWLVLAITLVVTSRVVYGVWRAFAAWQTRPNDSSWIAQSGLGGSLAAGAVVLGYYLLYWFGVRRRVRRHLRPTPRR